MDHLATVKKAGARTGPRMQTRHEYARLLRKRVFACSQLYLLLLPAVVFMFVFHYVPIYGIILAFKEYRAVDGILGSPWVGFRNFRIFFNSYSFAVTIRNTFLLSVYGIVAGFPLPIILAIMLHHANSSKFRRTVQTITYAPHFISVVVTVGMLFVFLSPSTGVVNHAIALFGGQRQLFMAEPRYFRHVFVWSGVWQSVGWSSIIYIAALTSIDPQQYEAAEIDGASESQTIIHIDIPGILPTVVVLLILSMGGILSVGFEKAFLMQTPPNLSVSEVLSTYVYRRAIMGGNMHIGTTVGLFSNVINATILVLANLVARRVSEVTLF